MYWKNYERPGYFGRSRDTKIAKYDALFGKDNWALTWIVNRINYTFIESCRDFYELSYLLYLEERPDLLDYICSFGECIDNATTNILSGYDYTKQESYSTHIQDIAIRNVLRKLNRRFEGDLSNILTIRSKDSNGFQFGPGNIPFIKPEWITQPSLAPKWAKEGSVEDFWQSNKWIQVKSNQALFKF